MFEEYTELFVSHLEATNKSEKTVQQYRREVEKFFDFLLSKKIEDIKRVEIIHIDLYQSLLMRRLASPSVARNMTVIRGFFNYLHSRKYIDENPVSVLEPVRIKDSDRKKKENLTVKEAMRLIESTEKNSIPSLKLRNKVFMLSFLFFGLRVSELCDLKVEDVSFKDKTVYIVDGKGGKNREVPLFDELIPIFRDYLRSRKVKSDYFFTTKQSERPLQPRAALSLVKHHAKKARIYKNINCHSLRRTTATLLLEDGLDLQTIKDFLGHASIQTTTLYLNRDKEKAKSEIRKGFSLAKHLKRKEL